MEIRKIGLPLDTKLSNNDLQETVDKNKGFKDVLNEALNKVNDSLAYAEKMTQDFALGKDVEMHQVILASEQANLALQLTVQIRNKVVEAYQEVMRMQV